MKNVAIIDKKNCTGCLACYNVCLHNAIDITTNHEGFCEPNVDQDKCINCGMCVNVCAKLYDNIQYIQVQEAHAVICNDDLRDKCSSGGFWGAIATYFGSNGGDVYGAVFSDDFRKVSHQRLQTIEEIQKSFGSKYLQSDIGYVYRSVKNDLELGKKVLFSGCPCQVDALNRFLNKDYDNLVTIDILCHGVVSPWAYIKFLDEIFGDVDSDIKKVGFREKKYGWACNVVVEANDGTERVSPHSGDYFNAFLWGYSQRIACFECPYSRKERIGDLTIGDFWGIKSIIAEWNDIKGTSLVLINSEKGKNIYSNLQKYIRIDNECSYSEVLDKTGDINWALVKPGIKPNMRDVFFYRLHRGDSFSDAFKYASTGEFDVGIFGWWFEDDWTNYGSTLTYYALMEYVSSLGLSVCMIPSPFHKAQNASEFVKKHGYRICETYQFEYFWKHNDKIKTFLLGSDQLWFYSCYKEWGHSLFFDFVSDKKNKIAYATSFGHADPKIPETEKKEIKRLLKRFDGISIRENAGVEYLYNEMDIKSVQTMDPVFLVDRYLWEEMAVGAKRKKEGDFIFAYILDPNSEKIDALKYLGEELNMPVTVITDRQYGRKEKEKMLSEFDIIRSASIYELIFHINNAKYVATDSYHGTCFSLIFQKKFISFMNPKRGISRFETLAEILGINDRFIYDINDFKENKNIFDRPNYFEISRLLNKAVNRSKAWLDNQLLNKSQVKTS